MEIHALRATISEKDLNDLARKYVPEDQPIEDLRIRLAADGVHIHGVYPLFVNVGFETRWQLGVRDGMITACLSHFKAMGIPGNVFRSAILKFIADAAKDEKWLRVEQETIVADVAGILLKNGLKARTHFTKVACGDGVITVEAEASVDMPA